MRDTCGRKGILGPSLPCPYSGPPVEPEDSTARELLVSTCGPDYADGPVCCTQEQVETLRTNFGMVDKFVSTCPACRNNFRQFFCAFTCSPFQGNFVNVTRTQISREHQQAVKSVDFHVGQQFSSGFFNSCKDVQFGAANSFAMTFIGGGARNASAFLKYLGDEKDIGSPFQIDFPDSSPGGYEPFDPNPRSCSANDLTSRCPCIDCPDVCPSLPYVPPPDSTPTCQVGGITCLSFVLTLAYCLALLGAISGYLLEATMRRRKARHREGLVLGGETASDTYLSPRSHSRTLVGASSLARHTDGEDSLGGQSGDSRNLGRGASLLDPIETLQPRQYRINTLLRRSFYSLGAFCANYPWLTFAIVFACVGSLNLGWKKFEVEKDPVKLWVAPNSESKLQKDFFDVKFGPFYRTEQIFVTSSLSVTDHSANNSADALAETERLPVLSWDHLKWWFGVEEGIRSLRSSPNNYGLSDVCFKPAGPQGACVVQSVAAWFGNSLDDYDEETWSTRLKYCSATPTECLPDYMQPLSPEYVLGGRPSDDAPESGRNWLEAKAMITTYVVSDSLDVVEQEKVMEWERALRTFLQTQSDISKSNANLEISFSTGISLEEELNKSTNMDIKIVLLSYLMMFAYVAMTLGNGASGQDEEGVTGSLMRWATNIPQLFSNRISSSTTSIDSRNTPRWFPRFPRSILVSSRFSLGLFGIGLVVLSVSSSVGVFSAMGVKVTLIIAEVIPFLVLAVGVDNVFILVHELDRQTALHGPNMLSAVQSYGNNQGPASPTQPRRSPFSSSHDDSVDAISVPLNLTPEERVARTLAKMGPSILLSTITETTAFALGALVPMPAVRNFALYAAGSVFLNAVLQVTVFVSAMTLDLRRLEANRMDCFPCIRIPPRILLPDSSPGPGLGKFAWFIRRYYAKLLLYPAVKGFVILIFTGTFVGSVISMQHIQLGLDRRLALPSDSYLIPYFNDLDSYFDVGPPVYFITIDVDPTTRPGQQRLCGRFTTCNDFSVANILEGERKRRESSFISQPAASWIDDFMNWLDPLNDECCRIRKADHSIFCNPQDPGRRCQACFADRTPSWNITMEGFPEGPEFMRYLEQWLISPTNEECPLGGQSSYSSSISFTSGQSVDASHFRSFHSSLKTDEDFINAFAAAHRIADDISQQTGMTVFPYSVFYVFFDQYAHVVAITQEILGLGLAAVLLITAVLLGSWRTGTIVTGVVALTVVNVMGVMGVWHISLNAISLVNLVISLGIAVEFCAHIARAFMGAGTGIPVDHMSGQKERDERMLLALVEVGPSVLSGITFTKLIGISVLALTRSKLLEIYYFRMWLTLIVSGALHGLILLPVILSLAGGPGYAIEDADEEWMTNATRRHEYEYTPFLTDNDSIDSY
ncbi:multidrug efflux transporter AcrB transmembrane domain-containing protein [Rickenella mellea]|uniref:Multidrug efflux transporter AcrB transmembrane domain-containing protein n=1 Tax=Rickenella mellea TaxID=50990 RepID=A0A4R5XE97_9AGAM|nr:multidrug efflux transporter AcrB transmembrane domain-containing protein [Rickenella mellea]